MARLNPIFNELPQYLGDQNNRLDILEKARQNYQGDWFELNIAGMAYVSGNVISFPNITGGYLLQLGDKIRIFQGVGYKYFYIIGISGNNYTLSGGSDYTFDLNTFTSFGFSRIVNPSGHPIWFNYVPTFSAKAPMTITSSTVNSCTFRLNGTAVDVRINVNVVLGGTASQSWLTTLPIIGAETYNLRWIGYAVAGGFTSDTCIAYLNTLSEDRVSYTAIDYRNWQLVSGNVVQVNFTYRYA